MGFGSGEGFTPGRNNLVGDFTVEGNISASAALSGAFFFGDGSFLQNVTGSGGAANSIKVGNNVDSGTANRVLYENASSDLAESANLTFDGTTLAAPATTVTSLSGTAIASALQAPYITASMGALFKRNADNADRSPLVAISGASGTEGLNSQVKSALWVSGSGNLSKHPVVTILSDGFYPIKLQTDNKHCAFMMQAGQGLDGSGDRVPLTERNLITKYLPPIALQSDNSRVWSFGVDCEEADYRRFRIVNNEALGMTSSSGLGLSATGSVEAGGRYGEVFWGLNIDNPAHTLDINGGLCVTGSTILGADATSSVSVIGTLTGSGLASNIEMPYITASMGALFKRNADNADRSPLVVISGASGTEGLNSQVQSALWVSGSGNLSKHPVVRIFSDGFYPLKIQADNNHCAFIMQAGQGLDDNGDRVPSTERNLNGKFVPPLDLQSDATRTWSWGVDCGTADYRRFRIINGQSLGITASSDLGFCATGSVEAGDRYGETFWGFNLNNPAHTLDINGGLCVTGSTILGTDATGSVNVVGNFFVNQATEATLADNTDALTIAQMLGRLAKITPTTSRSKATPTAAQIVAGITLPTVDQAWDFTIINLAAGGSGLQLTLTAGDGAVTLVGSMELNDASSGTFRVRLTNVSTEAVTIYRIS